jgi:xanthine dehydrogenase accessory factor
LSLAPQTPASSPLQALLAAVAQGRGAVKVTLLGGSVNGRKLVLADDGSVLAGEAPSGWRGLDAHKLGSALVDGRPWCQKAVVREEGVEAVCEPFPPRPRLLVCGAGHVAEALSHIVAGMQWQTHVLDDRPSYADPDRFPGATVWSEPFVQGLERFSPRQGDFVVLVTRGHQQDLACLRWLLTRPWRYLGMIGSRRRVWAVLRLLHEEGVPADLLLRIHAPIGLDVDAETPEEIALAIAGEMVKVLRGGRAASVRDRYAQQYARGLAKRAQEPPD